MKQKQIQVLLSALSVIISLIIAGSLIDRNEAFINESNGATGPAFEELLFWFILIELFMLALIWGIPTFFKKRESQ